MTAAGGFRIGGTAVRGFSEDEHKDHLLAFV